MMYLESFDVFIARYNIKTSYDFELDELDTSPISWNYNLIAIEVSLSDDLNTDAIESIIDNIESKVKQAIPYTTSSKIYVELERAK